jgi:hypothetical protein
MAKINMADSSTAKITKRFVTFFLPVSMVRAN